MNPWTLLATCGPAAVLSVWWLHRIGRRTAVYVPRPRPTQADWDADFDAIVHAYQTTSTKER
ncbi:hypothetical protein ACWGB8_01675 [Kitasatospora sp. NPDC054939]